MASSQNTFTIELNPWHTRIVSAEYLAPLVRLHGCAQIDTEDGYFNALDSATVQQKQAHVIDNLHKGLKLSDRRAHVIVPDSIGYAQVIETPILSEKDLVSAIRYQADEFIPMSIDDTYFDIEVLRQDPKEKKLALLMVAVPKKVVDAIYQTVEFAGYEPAVLETEVSAYCRLAATLMKPKTSPGCYLIANLAWNGTSFYLMDEQTNTLLLHRTSKVGIQFLLKDIMVNLNVSQKQAVEMLQRDKADATIVSTLSAPLQELVQDIDQITTIALRQYNKQMSQIFFANYEYAAPAFISTFSQLVQVKTDVLPVSTICEKNTVFNSFSHEISAFAACIAASCEL